METKLAPGLLVASPSLRCPFFQRSVVLLVEHDEGGSLGFVVNRPSDMALDALVERLDLKDVAPNLPGDVWVGGPVAPDTGWVLYDPGTGDAGAAAVHLGPRLAVSASRELLSRLAKREGPKRYAVLLGYAGWGPGQLDEEIADGAWIPVELDPAVVFDTEVDRRWARALRSLGIDPARVVANRVADA